MGIDEFVEAWKPRWAGAENPFRESVQKLLDEERRRAMEECAKIADNHELWADGCRCCEDTSQNIRNAILFRVKDALIGKEVV